jgi:hypothetical protein
MLRSIGKISVKNAKRFDKKLRFSLILRYFSERKTVCCGTVQYDTVRYGTIRYGTVRYGTIRYDTVRYGTVRYDTVRYGTIRYDTVRYGTIRYDTVRYGTIRYDTVRYGTIRYDTVRTLYCIDRSGVSKPSARVVFRINWILVLHLTLNLAILIYI